MAHAMLDSVKCTGDMFVAYDEKKYSDRNLYGQFKHDRLAHADGRERRAKIAATPGSPYSTLDTSRVQC